MKESDITRKLRRAGWTLQLTGKSHIKAIPPCGGRFVILSGTPSDTRASKNILGVIKRMGYTI